MLEEKMKYTELDAQASLDVINILELSDDCVQTLIAAYRSLFSLYQEDAMASAIWDLNYWLKQGRSVQCFYVQKSTDFAALPIVETSGLLLVSGFESLDDICMVSNRVESYMGEELNLIVCMEDVSAIKGMCMLYEFRSEGVGAY